MSELTVTITLDEYRELLTKAVHLGELCEEYSNKWHETTQIADVLRWYLLHVRGEQQAVVDDLTLRYYKYLDCVEQKRQAEMCERYTLRKNDNCEQIR